VTTPLGHRDTAGRREKASGDTELDREDGAVELSCVRSAVRVPVTVTHHLIFDSNKHHTSDASQDDAGSFSFGRRCLRPTVGREPHQKRGVSGKGMEAMGGIFSQTSNSG